MARLVKNIAAVTWVEWWEMSIELFYTEAYLDPLEIKTIQTVGLFVGLGLGISVIF